MKLRFTQNYPNHMEPEAHLREQDMDQTLVPRLVAILFAAGDPVKKNEIAKSFDVTFGDVMQLVSRVNEQLRPMGLVVAQDQATLQLMNAPEMSDAVQQWGKAVADTPLSPAAIEALSIVAYLPDVTKAEIDYIRGVNSAITLRTLATRGLVRAKGDGGIARYQVTVDALRVFGCSSQRGLPDWEVLHQQLKEQLGQATAPVLE